MAHIEVIAKPRDANERYQFFHNRETGNKWKASVEIKDADAMLFDDLEVAPTTIAVTVIVSPIEDNGKALRDAQDRPIIIDSVTHTFTPVEMENPDFNPEARILRMIAERVELGETKLRGNEKIKKFVDKWGGKNKIKSPPIRFEREQS